MLWREDRWRDARASCAGLPDGERMTKTKKVTGTISVQHRPPFELWALIVILTIGFFVETAYLIQLHHVVRPLASPTGPDGFHAECATWVNVTRSFDPSFKEKLRDAAFDECPVPQICSTWIDYDAERLRECRLESVFNLYPKDRCLQDKLAAIERTYPTYYYNETVCVKEVLARDLRVRT